jgi:hypothetical protein
VLAANGGGLLSGTGVSTSPNVDPGVRIKYRELAEIARLHVGDVMQLEVPATEPDVATPEQWAQQTLEAYRPLFTDLATSLGGTDDLPAEMASDPMAQMMAGLGKMMAPAMMGMSVGSMVGNLARRAFGVYDLPIPRATPALVLVPSNIDRFAADWSIELDEMRLWVLAHELAGLTLFSSTTSPTTCARWCSATSADSVPTRRPCPTSSRRSTSTRATRWPRCSRPSVTPKCCSVPFVHRNSWRSSPNSTRPSR